MSFASFVNQIVSLLNTIVVPLISALAFIAFLWGVVNYFFLNGGDPKKREEGKQFVIWGLLGLVALFSVWGIVNILLSTLGIAPAA